MPEFDVVLIGGPPGAGKSTLGRALACELGWSSLTVDDLVVAARAVTTPESHPPLHEVARMGHVRYFTNGPPERLIADAIALGDVTWPVVEQVVRSHLISRSPVVIDWWLLSPRRVVDLGDQRVRSLWLHIDPAALEARERANTAWTEGSSDSQRMLDHFMARSLWRNELVAAEAAEVGLPVLSLDGTESVARMVRRACGALGPIPGTI